MPAAMLAPISGIYIPLVIHRQHGSIVDLELLKRVVNMNLDGSQRQAKIAGDLLVAETARHERGDLALAGRQPGAVAHFSPSSFFSSQCGSAFNAAIDAAMPRMSCLAPSKETPEQAY